MLRDLLAEQRNTILGIDLGTTNSLVAVAVDCSTRIIASPEGDVSLPSAIALNDAGKLIVGKPARERRVSNPGSTITSIKRFMGLDAASAQEHASHAGYELTQNESSEGVASVTLGDQTLSAPEVSALYLRELKRWAETDLGKSIDKAVITVPAYFNEAQRQATRDAGRIAGLEVLRIVNEPTAAALAYGLQQDQQGKVAVFDFGGGTFDVSILELTEGVFEVLATGGDTHLGGDDIDWAIAEQLFSRTLLASDAKLEAQSKELQQAFIHAAENAKIQLSKHARITVIIDLPGQPEWTTELTREELESFAAPIVERTLSISREVLNASGLDQSELAEVLLVGGSTRMPLVQRKVAELFGKSPRWDIDPEQVVALGAAVQARILAGGLEHMVLLDVTPLSLGLETWGGAFDILIPRNTTVPASASEGFTTNVDGQTKIKFHVLQGERELASDNRSLGEFVLSGIPPMSAGEPRVEVTFSLDADGLLQVKAKERVSGQEASIEMRPSSGLSSEQVDAIIKSSYDNAAEDFQSRILLDRRTEAESVLRAVNKALKQSSDDLTPEYKAQVEAARDQLQASFEGANPDAIKQALEHINETTEELATVQMNAVLAHSVRGKTLDDVSNS